MGFLSAQEVNLIGFKSVGRKVEISDKAVFYNASNIVIGDYSRIDDFCLLSAGQGGIEIGRFVHIANNCSIQGSERIVFEDFSGLSSRVAIYSSSDDYSGNALTNPCVSERYTNVDRREVVLEKHVIVGVHSTVLPGVTIGLGAAIGAYSLVSRDIEEFKIAVGVPAKPIKNRSRKVLELERQFLSDIDD